MTSKSLCCPFCLALLDDAETCSACSETVPSALSRGGTTTRLMPMPMLGWPGHGRSVYLNALLYSTTRLNLLWPRCSYRELTHETRQFLTEAQQFCHTGTLPKRTPKARQPRLLLLLKDLGPWTDLVLAAEEVSGHYFVDSSVTRSHVPFLLRSPCAFLMVSPVDLERGDWRMVDMLLNAYLDTIEDMGLDPSKPSRGLVITLTKADLLFPQLPGILQRYLKRDALAPLLRPRASRLSSGLRDEQALDFGNKDLAVYRNELTDIDLALRSWLGQDPHFKSLQLKAEQYGIETKYALVSSLGEPPGKANSLPTPWRPCRVLDPLIWFLELSADLDDVVSFNRALKRSIAPPGSFSLEVTTPAAATKKADLRNTTGDFARLSPNLSAWSFEVVATGVVFATRSAQTVRIDRDGQWSDETGDRFLLEPDERLRIDGWEFLIKAGYFRKADD